MRDSRFSNSPFEGGSLLDKSTAKCPANLDMSIFDKKKPSGPLGQGTTSSDYLQKTKADNPDPPEAKPTLSIKLSECKINSSSDKMDVGKDVEVECQAEFINNNTPQNAKVTFTFSVEGVDCADPLIGCLDLDSKTQTVTVTGKLPSPPSKPPAGTKVVYVVTATHPQAEQPAKSDSVEILVTYPGDDADDGEHIEDRTVVITTEDGGLLAGAQYVLCEDGKAFKKGKLNPDSLLAYKAKPGCKYSAYMVNADEVNESEQEENSQDV